MDGRSNHRASEESLSIAKILRGLLEGPKERLTVGDLADAYGARGFGALMFAFAIPNLLPLPPGSSTFLSIPLLIIAPQVILGGASVWLPKGLRQRSLKRQDLARAMGKSLTRLEKLERLLRPRLGFLFGPVGERLIGLVVLALSLVLVLPIPLGNLLPAAAIAALSLGLVQRDGWLVLLGYGIATASVVVLFLSAHAVVTAIRQLLRLIGAD